MSYLISHEQSARCITKILTMAEGLPALATGEREHFLEIFGPANARGNVLAVPMTFDRPALARARTHAVHTGDLRKAFVKHTMLGDGPPQADAIQDAPWWPSYYWRQTNSKCALCNEALQEDRGISIFCHHQACTRCVVQQTATHWDSVDFTTSCPACRTRTRFYLFNGEQCNDDRTHNDIILLEVV